MVLGFFWGFGVLDASGLGSRDVGFRVLGFLGLGVWGCRGSGGLGV